MGNRRKLATWMGLVAIMGLGIMIGSPGVYAALAVGPTLGALVILMALIWAGF